MSTEETIESIHATLDDLGAWKEWTRKPYQEDVTTPTISERIRGLHRELNEAAAKAVVDARERAETSASHSILDECNRTIAALRAAASAEEAARLATERADRMDTQWAAAERRAAALEEEAQRLRADVERLSAQLDYATELCLAGFRQ